MKPTPKPCNESWDDMSPADGGRFCDRCERRIMDFMDISDADLKNLIAESGGRICGMFDAKQLNRLHFRKELRPAMAGWQKAAAAIAAITALSGTLSAQQPAVRGEYHMKEQRCETVHNPHRHESTSNSEAETHESAPVIRKYVFRAEKFLRGPFRKKSARPIEDLKVVVMDGVGGDILFSKEMHAENGEYVLEEPAAEVWPEHVYVQVTYKKKKVKWISVSADPSYAAKVQFNQKQFRRRHRRDAYLGYF